MKNLRIASTIGLLAACLPACGPTRPAEPPEPSLAKQVQAVRDHHSDSIRVDHAVVSDDDLEQLDGLEENLKRINFSRTLITDAGLARLGRFTQLEQLRLASGRISDAGLANLEPLEHLRFLHLIDAPITDTGLDRLQGLASLESLYLDGAKVTDDGIERFVKARPAVHFHVDGGHHRLDPQALGHQHKANSPPKD